MNPSERWQHIAPASDEPGQQRSAPDFRKRRQAVAVACVQCRSGKAKCDGTRPRCTRCKDNDLQCQYDVAPGVTRSERMKLLKRDNMSNRVEEMERVMRALRSGSDVQATSILARIRLGERVEEVAKTLPPTSNSPGQSGYVSLHSQDSSSTQTSGASVDSTTVFNSSSASPFRRGSETSIGYQPTWTPVMSTTTYSQSPSSKGKQPASTQSTEPRFLHRLFDRDDFLLARDDSDDDDVAYGVETVDPRLLLQGSLDGGSGGVGSPMELGHSRVPSPQKEQFGGSLRITHLQHRQPIVNTIRIHPNLDIRPRFRSMTYTSGLYGSESVPKVDDTRMDDLFIPTWAMMTVNTRQDPGSIKDAFQGILQEAIAMLDTGTPAEMIIEKHPNIAALLSEEDYQKSGILSKWAAGMVHSMLLRGDDFTAFALMYLLWYLMRWMISPSADTYETVPEWYRPTPNQLFMPHISILDFIVWPAFREFAVEIPEMQEQMEWLMDMSITLQCDWPFTTDEALRRDEDTGLLDLCDSAKASLRDLSCWSVSPSFRAYISNADSYLRIRTD